jgi:chromosomal replication initiation ATPase DnaA
MIDEFIKLTKIPGSTILSREKARNVADYRHVYWYLLKQAGFSVCSIASLNDVTHASVVYALNKVNVLLKLKDKRITGIYELTKHLPDDHSDRL